MKKLLIILAIVTLGSKIARAQKELVTLDEHNKYIFYKLIDTPGTKADVLYDKCLNGIIKSKHYQKLKPETIAGSSIKLKTVAMLYSNMTVAKHEAGELSYTLVAEFKDGKYRYWLTDFIFAPYERTRYGVYAKKPGEALTLEEAKTKYDERTMNNYLEQIAKLGKETGQEMTFYLTEPAKKVTEPAKIDTRKW